MLPRMAALRSSALQPVESVQQLNVKFEAEIVRSPASLPSLRHRHHSFSLTWSPRAGSHVSRRSAESRICAVGGASATDVSLESEAGISYQKLQELLAAGEWELADEETRRLIIVLAGENAVKRKYVFFSEVKFMPGADLSTIDRLWRVYSNGKFGYSVQRKIMKRMEGDCTAFFKKVGWMKPLGSESPQFTYRAFPAEFMWELSPATPEGHLPLTNALRGAQLLKSLLSHPAFDFADDDLQAPSSSSPDLFTGDINRAPSQQQQPKKPLSINYSF